jgi:tetratricopeptide (TPR) repeat protein
VDRQTFIAVVEAALTLREATFAREASRAWLEQWPGDFRVRRLLAYAHAALDEHDAAVTHLQTVLSAEPEDPALYAQLAEWMSALNMQKESRSALACANALRQKTATDLALLPGWTDRLLAGVALLQARRFAEARAAFEAVVLSHQDFPLAAWLLVRSAFLEGDYAATLTHGETERTRWPACAPMLICLAQASFAQGNDTRGVEYMHLASRADPAHEAAEKLFGPFNPYRSLWPAKLTLELRITVPPQVAIAAGLNRLATSGRPRFDTEPVVPIPFEAPAAPGIPPAPLYTGEFIPVDATPGEVIAPLPGEQFRGPASKTTVEAAPAPARRVKMPHAPQVDKPDAPSAPARQDESLDDVRRELNALARRLGMRKALPDEEERQPAYIVITSLQVLARKFGAASQAKITAAIESAIRIQRARLGWAGYLIAVDDEARLHDFGLKPVTASNAWQVKQLLRQLDLSLAKRNEMVGAVLIVGGHEVIPFHLLPNPADDDDKDVPSDNPYATRDENYYVPEWPVGRIPTPQEGDIEFLLTALGKIGQVENPPSNHWLARLARWLNGLVHPLIVRFGRSFGYTAGVWRQASLGVFRTIGQPKAMLVSPPTSATTLPKEGLAFPRLSYFNLHGLEDAAEWYGQRAADNDSDVEFPVALSPHQVTNSGRAPAVVFTEACYGANTVGKDVDTALAMKFLASGTRSLAGSTKISYGAASTPLIAADLLARHFWTDVTRGIPTGEALRRAKLAFAQEMHDRQGYLDGEDQKTLISFIHLGDPMYEPVIGDGASHAKTLVRRKSHPTAPAVLHTARIDESSAPTDPQVELGLKRALRQYLPGMGEASLRYYQPSPERNSSGAVGSHAGSTARQPAWVVSLSRTSDTHGAAHTQYARVSLDASGRLLKLVVSR